MPETLTIHRGLEQNTLPSEPLFLTCLRAAVKIMLHNTSKWSSTELGKYLLVVDHHDLLWLRSFPFQMLSTNTFLLDSHNNQNHEKGQARIRTPTFTHEERSLGGNLSKLVQLIEVFLALFFFWSPYAAYGILVPQTGIEPAPPVLEARCPNYWTTREICFLILYPRPFYLHASKSRKRMLKQILPLFLGTHTKMFLDISGSQNISYKLCHFLLLIFLPNFWT